MVVTPGAFLVMVVAIAPIPAISAIVMAILGERRSTDGDGGGEQSRLEDLLHVRVPLVSLETGMLNGQF